MSLAKGLHRLGLADADLALLREAKAMFETALAECDLRGAPYLGAETRLSLGDVYLALAEIEGAPDLLDAASDHIRATQPVFERTSDAYYIREINRLKGVIGRLRA